MDKNESSDSAQDERDYRLPNYAGRTAHHETSNVLGKRKHDQMINDNDSSPEMKPKSNLGMVLKQDPLAYQRALES